MTDCQIFDGIVDLKGRKHRFPVAEGSEWCQVRPIKVRNHPAFTTITKEAKMLVAIHDIPKDTIIGYYAGTMVKDEDVTTRTWSPYCLEATTNSKYLVDAGKIGNNVRYINHYENIDEKPNVIFLTADFRLGGFAVVQVQTLIDIAAGTELLADYGKDYW
ncbi:MAG: SET domain-containing protein-lysine N-methyltransferase, partial [Candidatus Roizmanbacteria bacterium]